MSTRETRGDDPGPQAVLTNENRSAFHLEEFKTLKAEIAEDLKTAAANLQYALLLSAGISSWLIVNYQVAKTAHVPPLALGAAACVPLVFSALFGLMSKLLRERLDVKAKYLHDLETMFRTGQLGWERRWKGVSPHMTEWYKYTWYILLLFDAGFAAWGICNL